MEEAEQKVRGAENMHDAEKIQEKEGMQAVQGTQTIQEIQRTEETRKAQTGQVMEREEVPPCETMELIMESRSENEEFARVVTAVFASRLDPTLAALDDIKNAVSEAVTNAVIHGYRGAVGKIWLSASTWEKERLFSVTIRDEGTGIRDVEQAMEPMFTTCPEEGRSGMGFSFMEAFMDRVEVVSAPGKGTSVTMKKKIGR